MKDARTMLREAIFNFIRNDIPNGTEEEDLPYNPEDIPGNKPYFIPGTLIHEQAQSARNYKVVELHVMPIKVPECMYLEFSVKSN